MSCYPSPSYLDFSSWQKSQHVAEPILSSSLNLMGRFMLFVCHFPNSSSSKSKYIKRVSSVCEYWTKSLQTTEDLNSEAD